MSLENTTIVVNERWISDLIKIIEKYDQYEDSRQKIRKHIEKSVVKKKTAPKVGKNTNKPMTKISKIKKDVEPKIKKVTKKPVVKR